VGNKETGPRKAYFGCKVHTVHAYITKVYSPDRSQPDVWRDVQRAAADLGAVLGAWDRGAGAVKTTLHGEWLTGRSAAGAVEDAEALSAQGEVDDVPDAMLEASAAAAESGEVEGTGEVQGPCDCDVTCNGRTPPLWGFAPCRWAPLAVP
jgi:hypothetical protein